jgi:putative resolvase
MSAIECNGAEALSLGATGLLSVGQACKLAGCHPNTLRKYANSGRLPAYRVQGGKRKFLRDDLLEFFGLQKNKEENVSGGIILYARISDGRRSKGFSKGEGGSDLARQVARLKAYALEHYGEESPEVLADTGSGLSFERKNFCRLIDGMLSGRYQNKLLLLTHPERLCRIARSLVEKIAHHANVTIKYTEETEELESDESPSVLIVEFCSSVISRIYSKRSADRYRKVLSPQVVERIKKLRSDGCAISKISEILTAEGLRCDDGAAVGIGPIKRYLAEKIELEKTAESSLEKFVAENVMQGASGLRLRKEDFYGEYVGFCRERGINPITSHHVGRKMTLLGFTWIAIHDERTGTKAAWKGIYIKQREKLSITHKEKPPKKSQPPKTDNDSFTLFYKTHLAGKFMGYSRELWESYKSWCKANGQKPAKFNTIPMQLLTLGGHHSKKFGTGGLLYDLTKKPPTHSSSNS